jgi:D-amino-acid dehydrogenase
MQALETELQKRGVEIQRGVEVRGWITRGNKIQAVQTTHGGIDAESVVLAGGIWSDSLARDLELRIPMQAGKGYSVTLNAPRQLPNLCSILVEARVAVTPMAGRLRFGGTMELAGINTAINPRRVQGLIKSVLKYFPQFRSEDFMNVPAWSGMRPCSPDGLPYLGRTGKYENLIVATGHAMMGMSLGPITGQIVAELLDGQRPRVEIRLLNPDRYA